jgi:hypothetical protein
VKTAVNVAVVLRGLVNVRIKSEVPPGVVESGTKALLTLGLATNKLDEDVP